MAYFKNLPNVIYPTQQSKKNSARDYTKIKNFFKRAYIPDDVLKVYAAFEDYKIIGDERPDQVSQKYYQNSEYDWLIFIANNIQNVRTDWPMTQADLNSFLFSKYTEEELSQVHHYETTEVRNYLGHVILEAGIKVKSDFVFQYSETIGANIQVNTLTPVNEITNYEYELKVNDDKRTIVLLRPEFVRTVENEISKIFRYKPSSAFVDEFNIKVSSQCIPPI